MHRIVKKELIIGLALLLVVGIFLFPAFITGTLGLMLVIISAIKGGAERGIHGCCLGHSGHGGDSRPSQPLSQ